MLTTVLPDEAAIRHRLRPGRRRRRRWPICRTSSGSARPPACPGIEVRELVASAPAWWSSAPTDGGSSRPQGRGSCRRLVRAGAPVRPAGPAHRAVPHRPRPGRDELLRRSHRPGRRCGPSPWCSGCSAATTSPSAQVCELAGAVDPAVIEGCSGRHPGPAQPGLPGPAGRRHRRRPRPTSRRSCGATGSGTRGRSRARSTGRDRAVRDHAAAPGRPAGRDARHRRRRAVRRARRAGERPVAAPVQHLRGAGRARRPGPGTASSILSGGDPAGGLWLTQLCSRVVTWMQAAGFSAPASWPSVLGGRPESEDADQLAMPGRA